MASTDEQPNNRSPLTLPPSATGGRSSTPPAMIQGAFPIPQIAPIPPPSLIPEHISSPANDMLGLLPPLASPTAQEPGHDLSTTTSPGHRRLFDKINLSKEILLTLHDGPLIFSLADLDFVYLLNPPSITLAKAPGLLWNAWDDSQGQGTCTSPLIVKGRKIAMKYWSSLLQQIGGNHWSQRKQAWGKLKV
jgi:hypothetical protein